MRIPFLPRFARQFPGRTLLAVISGAALLLAAFVVWASWSPSPSANQVTWNSPTIVDAATRLTARGCQVRTSAGAVSTLGDLEQYLPAAISQKFRREVYEYEVKLDPALLTDENLELISRYPEIAVRLTGTSIADSAIMTVGKLPNLRTLFLEETAASDASLAALEATRPVTIVLCRAGQPVGIFGHPPVVGQSVARTGTPAAK